MLAIFRQYYQYGVDIGMKPVRGKRNVVVVVIRKPHIVQRYFGVRRGGFPGLSKDFVACFKQFAVSRI